MNQLIVLGIACVVAAVVGGGFKWAGVQLPIIASTRRQIALAAFGFLILIASSLSPMHTYISAQREPTYAGLKATDIASLSGPAPSPNRKRAYLGSGIPSTGYSSDLPNRGRDYCIITEDAAFIKGMLTSCYDDHDACNALAKAASASESGFLFPSRCVPNPGKFYCLVFAGNDKGGEVECHDRLTTCLERKSQLISIDRRVEGCSEFVRPRWWQFWKPQS